ncbi:unnamed protein product [Pylaiella littoralis]
MKGAMLLLATPCVLPPASAFLPPPLSASLGALPQRTRRRTLTAQVAVALDPPGPTTLPKGKRIVRKKRRQQPTQPAAPVDTSEAPVTLVKSNTEYDAILRENNNTLVVIKFFAPWCRSCKALDVKYRRMAVKYEKVTFVEIDVHQSPELKKALGVRAVPTVKLHAGSLGQVASFTCGPKKAPDLERKIKLCEDVPGMAARLGQGGGMMEMVAGEIDSDNAASSSPRSLQSPRQDLDGPAESVAKGLMEKLALQEKMSESLQEQLDELPMNDGL